MKTTTLIITEHSRPAQRIVDVAFASLALLALSPFMVAFAMAIRVTSKGPVLFRQERVGQGRRTFTMLKFRSMVANADERAHREYVTRLLTDSPNEINEKGKYKLTGDPRITPIGAFLRRFSLDELPQFINVIRGDMSVVGPRPALAFEVDLYNPEDMERFAVRPGLTGLWQVSGRNSLSMREMLALDVEYVHRKSALLDARIISKTATAMIRGDGAE